MPALIKVAGALLVVVVITSAFSVAWSLAASDSGWLANHNGWSQIDGRDGKSSPDEVLTFQEQSPRCDHNVYPGAENVYGDRLLEKNPVDPGNTVCVHAGTYSGDLGFYNFVGTPEQPIVITNVDGQVVVRRGVLRLISSQNVILDGGGVEGVTYGFKVLDSPTTGLVIRQDKGHVDSKGYGILNIEAHHIEILYDRTHGLHAVSARNDDGSEPVENLSMHDLYVHRTKRYPLETSGNYREGFYIGSTDYNTQDAATLTGVEIYNNLVEESGWDGIQVGSASGGCEISNNIIIRDSREYIRYQTSGIMVNLGSKCDVYNNKILESHGAGIAHQGIGGHVYNNLIVLADQIEAEPMTDRSLADGREPVPDGTETRRGIFLLRTSDARNGYARGDIFAYNNTIMSAKRYAIDKIDENIGNYKIFNNLIVDSENGIAGSDPSRIFANYEGQALDVNFRDLANQDYHLTEQSGVAIDQGAWDNDNWAVSDLDGRSRVGLPDIGAYEYLGSLPNPTSSPPPTPSDSITPTATPSPVTRTPGPTPLPGSDPSPAATASPTRPPRAANTLVPTRTPIPTFTPTPTPTPTATYTPTPTPTPNLPPICTTASPSISTLWSPDHTFVDVDVLGVTDPEGEAVVISIDRIFQDEPVDGNGDGSFTPDGRGVGTSTAQVRAERAGGGNGRVYHVFFSATDAFGGSCQSEVLVGVPNSQGESTAPVDDGALFDSTALTP